MDKVGGNCLDLLSLYCHSVSNHTMLLGCARLCVDTAFMFVKYHPF